MVLKQISFSNEFTADALDSMIYMTALLPKPEPEKMPEKPVIESVRSVEEVIESARAVDEATASVTRGVKATPSGDQNRRTIGNIEFVRVPAGKFVMGSKDDNNLAFGDEKPQHTVEIPYDYWIAKFILTNEQNAQYLGKQNHPVKDWQKKKDHPVVNVSWDDAVAYCRWFNETYQGELKETGNLILRLPTEAEWEKAARGAYGNEWPWGNEFDQNKCNSTEGKKGGTTPVGAYSAVGGDSPYGCADMAGNVWEWTHSLFVKYPYNDATDAREDEKSKNSRVLRGGSFGSDRSDARCAYRYSYNPGFRNGDFGFRFVVSPSLISDL